MDWALSTAPILGPTFVNRLARYRPRTSSDWSRTESMKRRSLGSARRFATILFGTCRLSGRLPPQQKAAEAQKGYSRPRKAQARSRDRGAAGDRIRAAGLASPGVDPSHWAGSEILLCARGASADRSWI